ncbi:putative sugar hydrolase [Calothrix sp. NIES-4071]|nr:putative sugar hydrolase [Calothrix sp. NIES-4071]BAZ61456.1 putative sugar hydrolase [Calothrix sp. NIES-4105]
MSTSSQLERFGNHLLIGISATHLNDDDKRLLSTVKPIGIVFYGKNFQAGRHYEVWLQTFKELSAQIRLYAERDAMFMTLDHEGGRVHRPPFPITRFPEAYLASSHAREVAVCAAIELKSMGINVSWAPDADIYSNPNNPIIGTRAFGTTPDSATLGALSYLDGLRSEGIIGCAKHFPGHGDTSTDSHLELPVLHLTKEELQTRELLPFQALIGAKVPMVMTAHILFPKIDANVPATLSKTILTGILREELGFEGVIVSDDLDMKAVADMYAKPGTVTQTFNAGCDLLMVSRNLPSSSIERTIAIAQDFADSINNGSLDEEIVESAKIRVDKLLAMTGQYEAHLLDKEILRRHAELVIDCAFTNQ